MYSPVYDVTLKNFAPVIKTGSVTTQEGTANNVASVSKRSGENVYDVNFSVPYVKLTDGEGTISFDSDTTTGPAGRAEVTLSGSGLNRTISVNIANPVIANASTYKSTFTISPERDIEPSVVVSQQGNKIKFDFTLPNLWDDGELA